MCHIYIIYVVLLLRAYVHTYIDDDDLIIVLYIKYAMFFIYYRLCHVIIMCDMYT